MVSTSCLSQKGIPADEAAPTSCTRVYVHSICFLIGPATRMLKRRFHLKPSVMHLLECASHACAFLLVWNKIRVINNQFYSVCESESKSASVARALQNNTIRRFACVRDTFSCETVGYATLPPKAISGGRRGQQVPHHAVGRLKFRCGGCWCVCFPARIPGGVPTGA